jgi:Zn-dependent M28 family amino/carboxypeptidase
MGATVRLFAVTAAMVAGAVFTAASAAVVKFTTDDARNAYSIASEFVRDCTPRDAGTIRGRLAANWIMDRVSRTGVDASVESFKADSPRGMKSFANVVVEFKGTKSKAPWIVLVSHFDTPPGIGKGFEGANEGASTTALLVALAGSIRRAGPLPDNIMLLWTDAEECMVSYSENDGLQGAKHALKCFKDRRRAVKSAIGLDMLGDRDLHIRMPANGTVVLQNAVFEAAKRAGLEGLVSFGKDTVKDDFAVFFDAGCPAVNLIDFEFGSGPGKNDYWHTEQDTMDKISAESLYKAGRLAVELLNMLEGNAK